MITKQKPVDEMFGSLLGASQPKKGAKTRKPKASPRNDLKTLTVRTPEPAPASSESDEAGALRAENLGLKERIAFLESEINAPQIESLKDRIAFLESEIKEYEALNPTLADVLGSTTTSDLILAIVPRVLGTCQSLASQIKSISSLLESIDKRLAQPQKADEPSERRLTRQQKKIVIIGALRRQIPDLRRQIEHLPCTFKFLGTEDSLNVSSSVDYIVVWTNFVNHSVTDKFKRDKRLVLSTGGLKNLANDIRALVSR